MELIIYPLGNSDIQAVVNGKSVRLDEVKFRHFTEFLYNALKNNEATPFWRNGDIYIKLNVAAPPTIFKGEKSKKENNDKKENNEEKKLSSNEFSFPLLYAVFDKEGIRSRKKSDFVFHFIVTNQNPPNDGDTIYLGKILKEFVLPYLFKPDKQEVENDEYLDEIQSKIKLIEIHDNPTDFAASLDFFKDYKTKYLNDLQKAIEIHIYFGPGIPTMNYAMLLELFNVDRTIFRYLTKDGENTKVVNVPIPRFLENEFLKNAVIKLIDKYDYNAAYNITTGVAYFKKLNYLLKIAYLIRSFRYAEIKSVKQEFYHEYGDDNENDIMDFFEDLCKDLEDNSTFLSNDLPVPYSAICKINLLVANIIADLSAEKINEAIAMLFRLDEELGKIVTEILLKIEIKKDANGTFEEFKKKIEEDKELSEYLNKEKVRYDNPNRFVYEKIIRFYSDHSERLRSDYERNAVNAFVKFLDEFLGENRSNDNNTLSSLRNLSPYAHGFEGLSKEVLKEKVGKSVDDISTHLALSIKEFFRAININPQKFKDKGFNCFEFDTGEKLLFKRINKELKEFIEKEKL